MKKVENLQQANLKEAGEKTSKDAWIVAGYDNFCVLA
jgi:hypothetical protein